MSITKIALIGATGRIGPAIHKALLDGGFEVTLLSREGSTSTDSLPSHPRQKIAKANFKDVDSLSSALAGIQGVVSNMSSGALLSQKIIIDAAIKAGVTRFIPSNFGADISLQVNRDIPFNAPKAEVQDYLIEQTRAHPSFSWSSIINGPLFDWCLNAGMFGDLKSHTATLWDGGNTKFSTTTLGSVGAAVVGVFHNLDATKNRELFVADTNITQNQIIAIVKSFDGKEWTTQTASTAEAYQAALDEMKKSQPNYELIIVNQLNRTMFAEEQAPCHEDKLDNDKVGLKLMTDEQVKAVINSCMP